LKLKIECKSKPLEYSLKYYLKDYLDEKGILITDDYEKKGLIIGKDIKKPFTKISLFLQLEKLLNLNKKREEKTLEEKIDTILNQCKKEILKIIKEHYGKK